MSISEVFYFKIRSDSVSFELISFRGWNCMSSLFHSPIHMPGSIAFTQMAVLNLLLEEITI